MKKKIEAFDGFLMAWIMLSIAVSLILIVVGLILGGGDEKRFLPGGMALCAGAMGIGGGYLMLRSGGMLGRATTWGTDLKWIDKSERPIYYWSAVLAGLACGTAIYILGILTIVFTWDKVMG